MAHTLLQALRHPPPTAYLTEFHSGDISSGEGDRTWVPAAAGPGGLSGGGLADASELYGPLAGAARTENSYIQHNGNSVSTAAVIGIFLAALLCTAVLLSVLMVALAAMWRRRCQDQAQAPTDEEKMAVQETYIHTEKIIQGESNKGLAYTHTEKVRFSTLVGYHAVVHSLFNCPNVLSSTAFAVSQPFC